VLRRAGNLALERILVDRGLVPAERLEAARSAGAGQERLADRVVAAGLISEEQLAQALSDELGYPFVAPVVGQIDADLVRRLPPALLRAHRALPLLDADEAVDVAFADPLDEDAITAVGDALERKVQPAVSTPSAILACIQGIAGVEAGTPEDDAHGESHWEASGAIRLHGLLLGCSLDGTTELHLVPGRGGGDVKKRRGGVLADAGRLAGGDYAALCARVRALAGDVGGPGGVAVRTFLDATFAGRRVRLSISVVPTEDGDAAVVTFDGARGAPSGVDPATLDRLAAFLARGEGVAVVNASRVERAADVLAAARARGKALATHWVWCGEGPAPDVGPAVRLRSERLPGGFPAAVAGALTLSPDVLVLAPRAGEVPPADAFLAARSGRRVVLVAAWRGEAETRSALSRTAVPAEAWPSLLRLVVDVDDPRPEGE
jgi:hypothetical protein